MISFHYGYWNWFHQTQQCSKHSEKKIDVSSKCILTCLDLTLPQCIQCSARVIEDLLKCLLAHSSLCCHWSMATQVIGQFTCSPWPLTLPADGASLLYTSMKEGKNLDVLYKYLVHRLYGFPFNMAAQVVERDAVFMWVTHYLHASPPI